MYKILSNIILIIYMQKQLSNTTNIKEKLEERLQIITEETEFLKRKQEEYIKQMHVFIQNVIF